MAGARACPTRRSPRSAPSMAAQTHNERPGVVEVIGRTRLTAQIPARCHCMYLLPPRPLRTQGRILGRSGVRPRRARPRGVLCTVFSRVHPAWLAGQGTAGPPAATAEQIGFSRPPGRVPALVRRRSTPHPRPPTGSRRLPGSCSSPSCCGRGPRGTRASAAGHIAGGQQPWSASHGARHSASGPLLVRAGSLRPVVCPRHRLGRPWLRRPPERPTSRSERKTGHPRG
jgi:hypothetical protein